MSDNPFAKFAAEPAAPPAPDANPFARFATGGFDEAAELVRQKEGGFVNDPVDRGGATNHGISSRSHPDVDVRNLDWDGAKQIYRSKYWDAIGGDALPRETALVAFDAAVNHGVGVAQNLLKQTGGDPAAMIAERRRLYQDIIQRDPSQSRFAAGWENRLAQLESEIGGRPAPRRAAAQAASNEPDLLDEEGFRKRNPSYSPTESLAKGAKGLKLTWDFLADRLGRAVTGGDNSATPILERSVEEFSKMASDPRLQAVVELGDKAYEDRGAMSALYEVGKYVLQNPGMVASLLTEQVPGLIAGGPLGRATGVAAGRAAAAAGAGRVGIERATTGGFGAGISGSQTVLQGLGAEYAEGIQRGMDPETAANRALNKTAAEFGLNALAGSFLWLNPARSALANAGLQVGIQGTGGAAGAAAGSLAVGERPSFTEGVLEFVGEGAFAPIEAGLSRLGTRPEPSAEPTAPQSPGAPVAPASPVARGIEVMAGQQSDLAARVADLRRRVDSNEAFLRQESGGRLDAFRSQIGADRPFAGIESAEDTRGVRTPVDAAIALDQGEKLDAVRARFGVDRPFAGIEAASGREDTPVSEFLRESAQDRGIDQPVSRREVDSLLDEREDQAARQRAQDEAGLAQLARDTRTEESVLARPGVPENTAMADALSAWKTRRESGNTADSGAPAQPVAPKPVQPSPGSPAARFANATNQQLELAAREGSPRTKRIAQIELAKRRSRQNPDQRPAEPTPESPAADTVAPPTLETAAADGGVAPTQAGVAPEPLPQSTVAEKAPAEQRLASAKQRTGRKAPIADARLSSPDIAAELQAMAKEAGWSEVGGRVIRDEKGNVSGRTKWIPRAAWYGSMSDRMNGPDTQEAVRKAIAGEPLSAKETRSLTNMLAIAEEHVNAGRESAQPVPSAEPAPSEQFSTEDREQSGYNDLSDEGQALVDEAFDANLDAAIDAAWNSAPAAKALTDEELDAIFGPQTRQVGEQPAQTPASGAVERDANRAQAPPEEGFALSTQTQDELRAIDARARMAEEEQRKARERMAAPSADDFVLTGSSSTADEARARGQLELTEQPSLGLSAQAPTAETKAAETRDAKPETPARRPFKEEIAAIRAARDARRQAIRDAVVDGSVRLTSERLGPGLISPEPGREGRYRITRFDGDTPTGHTEYNSLEAAIDDASVQYEPDARAEDGGKGASQTIEDATLAASKKIVADLVDEFELKIGADGRSYYRTADDGSFVSIRPTTSGVVVAHNSRWKDSRGASNSVGSSDIYPDAAGARSSLVERLNWLEEKHGARRSIDAAAHDAATSPANDRPEPTEAQKEAGNYAKGHIRIAGLDISIENPAGTRRRPEWPVLPAHYGYVRSIRVKSQGPADASNNPAADAHLFGDSAEAQSIRSKGFDSLRVDRQKVVHGRMVSAFHDREILGAVIKSVPIDVVHGLVPSKPTTEQLLRDPSVFLNGFSGSLDNSVGAAAVARFIDTVATSHPPPLARLGAEKQAALGMSGTPPANGKNVAAGVTGNGSSHSAYYAPIAADGDHIDVFVNPGTAQDWNGQAFVIDQETRTGKFDEHKVMLGYPNEKDALHAYKSAYTPGHAHYRGVTPMTVPQFKAWLRDGDTTKRALGATLPRPDASTEKEGPESGSEKEIADAAAREIDARSGGQDGDRRAEPRGPDRRQDDATRKRVADMTPDEMRRALHEDVLTGLKNRRAWMETDKKPFIAALDVDSLGWINDNMGHDSGDKMLEAFADAFRRAGVDAFRTGGDEFMTHADDEVALRVQLETARGLLNQATVEGKDWTVTGLGLSFGIGTDEKIADERLYDDKRTREAAGLRAPRKEAPATARRRNESDREDNAAAGSAEAGSVDPAQGRDAGEAESATAASAGNGEAVGGGKSGEPAADGSRGNAAGKARAGDGAEKVDPAFSRKETQPGESFETAVVSMLAESDELFQQPRPAGKTVEAIAKEVNPSIAVAREKDGFAVVNGARNAWSMKMPSGATAYIYRDGRRIWIDVSRLKEGVDRGSMVYSIAAAFAHNNGNILVGDPNGLSESAYYRRTENMISSILKYGTSNHLSPHEAQTDPRKYYRSDRDFAYNRTTPIKWKLGDTAHNLLELMRAAYNNASYRMPEIQGARYNFDSSRFESSAGEVLSADWFAEQARTPTARSNRAGSSTLRRAVLFGSLVRASSEERSGILAAVQRQLSGRLDEDLKRTYYSKGRPASAGLSVSVAKSELKRIAAKWRNAPQFEVVANPAALPFPAPADARGAFWRGKVYLVASNLSDETDLQFTLFHEALGHHGLRGSLGPSMDLALSEIEARNANVKAAAAKWRAANPQGDLSAKGWHTLSIEEALSDMAGKGDEFTGLRRVLKYIQDVLRRFGLDRVADWMESHSDAEALAILADARKWVEQGDKAHVYAPALAAKWQRQAEPADQPKFSRVNSTVSDALDMIRSPGTVQGAIKQMGTLLESNGKFGLLAKSLQTQYHKATKDEHYSRVFHALLDQNNDTQHYAIEAEEQAPDLLLPMKHFGDVKKALAAALGGKYRKDVEAIAKPLFANIEGQRGVQQKVFTDDELRNDWKLTDRQVELYRQYRAAVDASLERLGQTLLIRVGRGYDLVTSQYKNRSLADTFEGIIADLNMRKRAEIDTAGKRPLVRSLTVDEQGKQRTEFIQQGAGVDKEKVAALDKAMDEVRELHDKVRGLIDSGYTPAMRFGRYAVTAYAPNDPEPAYFGLYESAVEANLAAAKLARSHASWVIQKGQVDPQMYELFRDVNPEMAEMFGRFMGLEENDAFKQYIALASASRSALKRQLDRQGTAGFSEDALRVLASFITSNARKSAADVHSGEVAAAIEAIPKQKGDVLGEARKLVDYLQNPKEEAGALRGLLFAQFMGGSVASAAVNLTQPVLMTAPYLSQFVGAGKLVGIMRTAAGIAMGRKPPNMELDHAMRRAAEDGLTEPQEIYQLQAEASGSAFGRSLVGRAFSKAWGGFFSLSESFNRRVSFAAAYQAAQDMGADKLRTAGYSSAYEFAKHAVFETQGLYNKVNRPNWARGPVGATVFTFRQFSIMWLEWFSRLPKQQQVLALAMLTLAAGVEGLPFAEDIEDLLDTIGQKMGYATNTKKQLRQLAADTLGKELGDFALHGLSTLPGMPIDVSARLGLHNLIPGTRVFNPSAKDKGKEVLEVAGAVGSLGKSAIDAVSSSKPSELLPKAVKDVYKAIEIATTGEYRDTKGKKVENADMVDAFVKAIGFQPSHIAARQRAVNEVQRDIDAVRRVEAEIADDWARAVVDNKQDAVRAAKERLQKWNEDNPDSPIRIDPGQITRRMKELRTARDDRIVKRAPAELRPRMAEALR